MLFLRCHVSAMNPLPRAPRPESSAMAPLAAQHTVRGEVPEQSALHLRGGGHAPASACPTSWISSNAKIPFRAPSTPCPPRTRH